MNPTALVLDDDPLAAEALAIHLRQLMPEVDVTTRMVPDVAGDFDVFFVDNTFGEARVGAEVVAEIRADRQNALIVAVSGTLDQPTLMALINAGCDFAVEKGSHADLGWAVQQVRQRLRPTKPRRRTSRIGSLLQLVRELNRHVDAPVRAEEA